uniref:Acyltransferase 3 domain-containing protein n=1 Tax=Branchiostoma floridae TaxID=7739 RepID=C3YJK1_BRAFL|eukprot:XP_002603297.1 hypothetical protein BRAFLDRAFT_71408 [Branchiostoma floridae]
MPWSRQANKRVPNTGEGLTSQRPSTEQHRDRLRQQIQQVWNETSPSSFQYLIGAIKPGSSAAAMLMFGLILLPSMPLEDQTVDELGNVARCELPPLQLPHAPLRNYIMPGLPGARKQFEAILARSRSLPGSADVMGRGDMLAQKTEIIAELAKKSPSDLQAPIRYNKFGMRHLRAASSILLVPSSPDHLQLQCSCLDLSWGYYNYYMKPYCRIGPYLVGIAVGWLLVKMKRKQTRSMTVRLLMTIGWLVAAASAMAVLYATYGKYHGTTLQTEAENVLYLTIHRTVWATALGWVVVACHHGYGGVVDIILSWDAWVPLSRLTYCAYLIHIQVVIAVYISMEVPIHYTTFTMIYFFLGHVALSYGLAFLVSVAVEVPLLGLEKVIFNK